MSDTINFEKQDYYNKQQKIHFLKIKKAERMNYTLFNRSKETEEHYQKDLSEFNLEQIEDLLFSIKCSSVKLLKIIIAFYKEYTDFCTVNNYRIGINYYELIPTTQEYLERYIDKDIRDNRYMYPNELENILDAYMESDSLKFFFRALWEGFDMDNIILLKPSDVNFENSTMNIINRKGNIIGNRYISKTLLSYIKETINETEYVSMGSTAKTAPLINNGYILKTTARKKSIEGEPIKKMTLYQRYNVAIEYMDKPYLKIANIGYSYSCYLGLLLKMVSANILNNKDFYKLLACIQKHSATSIHTIVEKLNYNLQNKNLQEKDINKDMIRTYILNIKDLQNNGVWSKIGVDASIYLNMLEELLIYANTKEVK